jgi:hypothetical protein
MEDSEGCRKKEGESLPLLPAFVAVQSMKKSVMSARQARDYRLPHDDAKKISEKKHLTFRNRLRWTSACGTARRVPQTDA